MRKIFFILIAIFSISNSFCQSSSEINKIIEGLSWESYRTFHSYRTFFVAQDEIYNMLVKDKRKSGEMLFSSIEKPEKTVAIHIYLTQIFEPDRNFFFPLIDFYSCNYITINPKKTAGTHFIYNGLVWESNANGTNSISKYQIERIRHLWDLRLHKNINSFELDTDTIIKEVRKNDAKKYACHDRKIYENNSSRIDISELQSLIGSKYPSSSFNSVFKRLGNDSTIYFVNNSHKISSISYETDGINFEFDNENNLRWIFIQPNYKGLLFNNLKMTDNKDEIKRKLGEPKEYVNIPRYKYDWIYEKYKMLIAFGHTNRIIDLQINNGNNP